MGTQIPTQDFLQCKLRWVWGLFLADGPSSAGYGVLPWSDPAGSGFLRSSSLTSPFSLYACTRWHCYTNQSMTSRRRHSVTSPGCS
jgi:hypothetical protein